MPLFLIQCWYCQSTTLTLKMRIQTHNSTLVYIQACGGQVYPPEKTQKKDLLDIHTQTLKTSINFNIKHAQFFSPPSYKTHGVNVRSPGLADRPLDECVSRADLGSVPMLVLSLSAPHCPGPSAICLEWQWAQLFLSFVMHSQADL